jgi:lysyl-tRNA synthetase class 2
MTKTIRDIIPDTDNDQTQAREKHLEAIRALVGNAYPNRFARTNVTASAEGEDTVSALADAHTIERIVGKREFAEARAALADKIEAGERPTPEDLAPLNAELNKIEVRVSGRLATPPRVMGKVAFVHLSDGKSRLQIYVRKDETRALSNDTGILLDEYESGWQLLQLLDHGDFIGVAGYMFVTKTGELSIHVKEIQFLAKALVPMPDKMHGISDPETGRRQRYVDLIASSLKIEREEGELTTREVFERRSKLITQMRAYLDAHGYVEVETPMLSPIASGAAARPFETFHKALGIKLYARIAPELYLKRLLVGGFERVYELNRNFRNEGIGYRWNPEFTMLEFYCAYMDVNGMMDFCEEMLRTTIETTTGGTCVLVGEKEIDFGQKLQRMSMTHAISVTWLNHPISGYFPEQLSEEWFTDTRNVSGLVKLWDWWRYGGVVADVVERASLMTESEIKNEYIDRITNKWEAIIADIDISDEDQTGRNIEHLFGEIAESFLFQPTFIYNFPKVISPLSKASPDDPSVAERFELYCAGMEIANGFSELNDPVEQYERFEDQARQRERGDDEAMQTDMDYVRALSYGMPPAAGIGIGIDRLTMLLTNKKSIRDVILFPHMRPQASKQAEEESVETTDGSE